MDFSHFNQEELRLLSFYCTLAEAKKPKKRRAFLEQEYCNERRLSAPLYECLSPLVPDEEFFAFLEEVHCWLEAEEARKTALLEKAIAASPQGVQEAFREILFQPIFGAFQEQGEDARLLLSFGGSHQRALCLWRARGLPEPPYDQLNLDELSFLEEEKLYRLAGEAISYEADSTRPFELFFEGAALEFQAFRAEETLFLNTPFEHLFGIASDLLEKHRLFEAELNPLEKEQFPLILELSKLSFWARIPDQYQKCGYPILKDYCARFALERPLALLEKLERAEKLERSTDSLKNSLTAALNKKACEPLWRHLYGQIQKSQEGYPSYQTLCKEEALLEEIRGRVERHLHALGYQGNYPDFLKIGPIPRLHLAESYDVTYFAGCTKRAAFHIHCSEIITEEGFFLEFFSGTELLKKGAEPKDFSSCLFFAGGRRFFSCLTFQYDRQTKSPQEALHDLPTYIRAAAKRAELIALTKGERIELQGFDGGLSLFLLSFLLMGGFFGLFMTLGMMLFAIVAGLFGGIAPAEMLSGVPWGWLGLLAGVLFGLPMAIITVLSKRK